MYFVVVEMLMRKFAPNNLEFDFLFIPFFLNYLIKRKRAIFSNIKASAIEVLGGSKPHE